MYVGNLLNFTVQVVNSYLPNKSIYYRVIGVIEESNTILKEGQLSQSESRDVIVRIITIRFCSL